jgi:hypothetical protein
MRAASCDNCGAPLPKRSRFCPECGVRTSSNGATSVEEVPTVENARMPANVSSTKPRYFGVTPPLIVFVLAVASIVLGIVLLVGGHVLAGALVLAAGALFALVFVAASRRRPDNAVVRLSTRAFGEVRDQAGFAVEAVSTHSWARRELFRLRRELAEIGSRRAEAVRELGEAVYGGADDEAEQARARIRELEQACARKEREMADVAAAAHQRLQRAQLRGQRTAVVEPPDVPEPMPVPSEPPQPVTVPEPAPVPSEPPAPVPAPDPTPEPSPPLPE